MDNKNYKITEWKPTMELKWKLSVQGGYRQHLHQLWISDSGKKEWRVIEITDKL